MPLTAKLKRRPETAVTQLHSTSEIRPEAPVLSFPRENDLSSDEWHLEHDPGPEHSRAYRSFFEATGVDVRKAIVINDQHGIRRLVAGHLTHGNSKAHLKFLMHGQRSLKTQRVEILKHAYKSRTWRPCNLMIVGVAPNEHGDVAPQMVNGQHTANLAAREPSFSAMMTYMFDERRTFKELQDDYAAADALPGRTKMDKLGALDPEMVEHLNKKAEEFYQVDPTLAADRLGLPKSKKKKDEEGVDYFVEADRSRFLQWMMFLLTKGSKSIEDRAALRIHRGRSRS